MIQDKLKIQEDVILFFAKLTPITLSFQRYWGDLRNVKRNHVLYHTLKEKVVTSFDF